MVQTGIGFPDGTARILRDLSSDSLDLRRTITPQAEVINKLARDDYVIIDAEDRVFFRDVYGHFTRLHYFIESTRDLVSGALETLSFGC